MKKNSSGRIQQRETAGGESRSDEDRELAFGATADPALSDLSVCVGGLRIN